MIRAIVKYVKITVIRTDFKRVTQMAQYSTLAGHLYYINIPSANVSNDNITSNYFPTLVLFV